MKKSVVVIIALIIVAAFSILSFSILNPQKPVIFEEIVPKSAIYYISASNLNRSIQNLKSSSAFKKFSETSLYIERLAPFLEEFSAKTPFIKDLLGKDIALAILSLGKAVGFEKTTRFDAGNVGDYLILIRIDRNKFPEIKRKIGETFIARYKSRITSSGYLGVNISSFNGAGQKQLHYAILSDTLVISNSLEGLQKSVDLFKKKSMRSIAKDDNFKQASSRVKKDSLVWGYKSSENYYADYLRQIQDAGGTKTESTILQMKSLMSFMDGFKDVSFFVDYDNQLKALVAKNYTFVDYSKDESGFLGIIARDQPLNPGVFSLIPKDAIGYYALNQDLIKCWNFWMNFFTSLSNTFSPPAAPGSDKPKVNLSPETALRTAESFLGINIKNDLIALLGDDLGIVLASLDDLEIPLVMPSFEPNMPAQTVNQRILFPQLYFFSGIKDNAKLDKVMEQLFQKIADNINSQAQEAQEQGVKQNEPAPLVISTENYKDAPIHYFEFQGFPLNPNYCILDKYFVFAISRDLTKKVIDLYKSGGESFNANADFTLIKDQLSKEYSSITFLDFAGLINSITRSALFKNLHKALETSPNAKFSAADLDSILSALGTLKKFTVTIHKVPGEDVLESQAVLTIEE